MVISPLVSLMEDQVAGLDNTGISAVMLGGSNAGNLALEDRAKRGEYALIYMAPEKVMCWVDGLRAIQQVSALFRFV